MFKKIINVCLTLLFVGSSVVANDYKPVSELDLNLYQGKWYQVYGDNFDKVFEKDGRCIQANYQIIDSNNVSVLNTQLNSKNQVENITGYAYYTDDHTGGELTVQLDGQGEAPYWVIELGPVVDNQYDYSIVSDNFKISLFVLARNVESYFKYYNDQVQESLQNFGFTNKLNKPIQTDQTNC